jgi:acetoacetyl-CoA reductase
MTPILNNICTLQMELMNQWYKSCDATVRSMTHALAFSPVTDNKLSRQEPVPLTTANDIAEAHQADSKKQKPVTTGLAIVTGGIGGIGTEICKRLATDGNRVIATYIAMESEKAAEWQKDLEKEGYDTEVYECDVSSFESCRAFAKQIEKKYGPVDILVNAAGITRDSMLRKMDPAKWHTVIDTNLDSVFNVTRNFINGMIKNKYGRIINISSVNGQKGQFGQTNYSTAKAGMIGFTRSLALELADKGITVNSVCPGYVHTSMVAAIREDVLESIIKQIPMGRLASVTEIADAVAFLAAKESAYITGTELAVNGGLWLG